MPRETRKRTTRLPTVDVTARPEKAAVVARPVHVPMPSGEGGDMNALLSGLARFNEKLTEYVHNQADRDLVSGMKARADGSPLSQDANEWFAHGHLAMSGRVAGQDDGEALRQSYETAFDKDAGDVEKLISDTWAERTKGLNDQSYLGGYQSTFAIAAEKLRADHREYQRTAVLQKNEANATKLLDGAVRGFVDAGKEVPQEELERIKSEFKRFGISRPKFAEMLFAVVDRMGDEGNFAIYDVLKRNNADGTPGIYYVPKWKEKIDAAQIKAQNVFLQKQIQARALAEKLREEKQDEALYGVFELAYGGNPEGAQTLFAEHVKRGLFSRASDLVKWQELFRKVETRELRPQEQTLMTETLTGIYTGKVGIRDILNTGLPPQQTRQLLSEWRTVVQQERQAAAEARANVDQPFKSHAFKEQEDWLESMLKPTHGALDRITEKDEFMYAARASAKLELAEYVRAHGLKDIRNKAIAIVERHKDRVQRFEDGLIAITAKSLRYATLQDATKAYENRQLSDRDFALHLEYFERNPSKGKRAAAPAAGSSVRKTGRESSDAPERPAPNVTYPYDPSVKYTPREIENMTRGDTRGPVSKWIDAHDPGRFIARSLGLEEGEEGQGNRN
jgi:hypothetical protein